jgi:hypothetical protein
MFKTFSYSVLQLRDELMSTDLKKSTMLSPLIWVIGYFSDQELNWVLWLGDDDSDLKEVKAEQGVQKKSTFLNILEG